MKQLARLLLVAALLAALSVVGVPALAGADDDGGASPPGGGGGQDVTFGAGNVPAFGGGTGAHFRFDARSGPQGENPSGTFDIGFPTGRASTGVVTCLQVVGNVAYIGGQRLTSTNPSQVGQGVTFSVRDNTAMLRPDEISGATEPALAPQPGTPKCGALEPAFEVTGEIVVQDSGAGGGGAGDGDDGGDDGDDGDDGDGDNGDG